MNYNWESTIDNPLLWFEYLVYHEGIKIENSKFLNDADMLDASLDKSRLSYIIHEQNVEGDWEHIKVDFKKILVKKINQQFRISMDFITESIRQNNDNNSKNNTLRRILDTIESLIQGSEKISYRDIIISKLIQIVENLKNRYQYLGIKHKVYRQAYRLKRTNESPSFFGSENLKPSYLKRICSVIYQNELLADGITDDDLYNILTSCKPEDEGIEIHFRMKNMEIAYIFQEMQPLFTKLDFNTVETSMSFFNKQDKIINRNDLDTALTRLRKKKIVKNFYQVPYSIIEVITEIRKTFQQLSPP